MRSGSTRSLLIVTTVVAAACGGSDGDAGGSDVDAFCERVTTVLSDDFDVTADGGAGVEVLRDLAAVAPAQPAADVRVVIDALDGVDFDDETAVLEALFTDEVFEASERLETFTATECDGLPARPLYDAAEDGEVDPSRPSRPGLAKFLDDEYGDAPWKSKLNGTGALSNASTLEVYGTGLDRDALDVCAAMLEYAAGYDTVETVLVRGDDDRQLAIGTPAGGCSLDGDPADDVVPEESAGVEVDDPLYDPFFDDPVDPNEASLDGMKLYFDTNHPDASWRPQLASFGISGGDDQRFSVGGANVEDFGVEICEALLGYSRQVGEDAEINVSTYVPNEGGGVGDETLIATGSELDGCTEV